MGEPSVPLPLTLHYMYSPPLSIIITALLCQSSCLGLMLGAGPVYQVAGGATHKQTDQRLPCTQPPAGWLSREGVSQSISCRRRAACQRLLERPAQSAGSQPENYYARWGWRWINGDVAPRFELCPRGIYSQISG